MQLVYNLLILAVLCFFQNMAFTWSSRTRNQSDHVAHRYAALCSNSIWFIVQVTIWKSVWQAATTGSYWNIVLTGIVYTLSTTEGSVWMMKHLVKKGK